ncbi:MAG: phosphotransferase family protein, partial [Microthrixaceae bacterium]
PRLTPRSAASSVDELIDGATERRPLVTGDGKSGSELELVVIDGERFVLKLLHPDADWTMRGFGDLACRPVAVWTSGLLDALPSSIDHAVVGAASGLGRNGWGGALLLHDVGAHLFPAGDAPISFHEHRQLLAHLAEMSAAFWEPGDAVPSLLSLESRWSAFGPSWMASEQARGWPDAVPKIACDGWERFARQVPADVERLVSELRHDLDALVVAARRTPQTFLHGDWKLGNVGADADRTVLLDWTYPGVGPAAHDLAWYLSLNRARLPESKEDAIGAFRAELERCGIVTDPWWDAQLALCLLGALVQFGWEKALGDEDELMWWCDRAREGGAHL